MTRKRSMTMAKRARELAVKERRERKQAKKADAATQRDEPTDAVNEPLAEEIAAPDTPEGQA